MDEFSDTFAWSYDELSGIPREMVKHRIPLIPGARPVRQETYQFECMLFGAMNVPMTFK